MLNGVVRAMAGSAFHADEGVVQRAAEQRLATDILAILSGQGRGLLAYDVDDPTTAPPKCNPYEIPHN